MTSGTAAAPRVSRGAPRRVAVLAGARTPFAKAGGAFAGEDALSLSVRAVTGLLERERLDPADLDALVFGAVVPLAGSPNLAREIVFAAGLPAAVEAHTLSSYCITGLRTVTAAAEAIAAGRVDVALAGGVEWLSGSDPRTVFREPSTGLSMAEHMERTLRELPVPRARQDELALASHRRAVRARERIAAELLPHAGLAADTGPRADTSLEALAALPPAFVPDGTLTAGNSSPVTDGASAVLLASEERARELGREPLAFVRASQYAALAPDEGLLMAPALAVPRLLSREGVALADVDLFEIHEAFAAQVLANAEAWERGWKEPAIGAPDWERVNVNGGTIALGHPWSATGGRLVTTLARELARRDGSLGLVSACAGGAMAGALLLERS